jgi:hypothetical protein
MRTSQAIAALQRPVRDGFLTETRRFQSVRIRSACPAAPAAQGPGAVRGVWLSSSFPRARNGQGYGGQTRIPSAGETASLHRRGVSAAAVRRPRNLRLWRACEGVTTHPAFRNAAASIAKLYDALPAPKTKGVLTGPTDTVFRRLHAPLLQDCPRARTPPLSDPIAQGARITYARTGCRPDYKAAFLDTLGANAEVYDKFACNPRAWHKLRPQPAGRAGKDVNVSIRKETSAGISVCGVIPSENVVIRRNAEHGRLRRGWLERPRFSQRGGRVHCGRGAAGGPAGVRSDTQGGEGLSRAAPCVSCPLPCPEGDPGAGQCLAPGGGRYLFNQCRVAGWRRLPIIRPNWPTP